jgi:4-aminobutyrate aminotransferase
VVVLRHSYSGRSATALSSVGHSSWRPLPAQVAGIVHAMAPYCYRCPFGATPDNCGAACANDIEEVIRTTTTGQIAAFMAEPILGVGGFIVPPAGYFERAYEITRNYGGLCISDEVQTGWGRTGGKWFGIEQWGVTPDIMTSAKGMGNGVPIGWTIATSEVADKYPGLTFATFGGNPVSMAVGLAVVNYIEENDLRTNAKVVGDYFRSRLDELKDKYQVIGDVRGMGLMQGLELVKDRTTKEPNPEAVLKVFEETKRQGVLIGKGGLYGNVIRTGMMLNTTKDSVDQLVTALDAGLATC